MATFGIEGIRYFANARANGVSTAEDLTYIFNICNGLDERLRSRGHTRRFYWANQNCWETDIRDTDQGGDDTSWVDDVDLFFITTHGNHEPDGQARLLYDVPKRGTADSRVNFVHPKDAGGVLVELVEPAGAS